jgi:hypothetical protein
MPLGRNALLDVTVERALFERSGAPHFYLHVRVTNVSDHPIGVDLRALHEVFYPNQWGASNERHRTVIDERRLSVPPLDAGAQTTLLEDYRAGRLTAAAAGAPLDYYVEFNASGRADVEKQASGYRFVLVAMDGRLRVADGSMALQLGPPAADEGRDCAIDAPVAWRAVPAGAVVVGER